MPEQALGIVIIGRNEGERLKRCLRSVLSQDVRAVVYADSGSTDGSVDFARQQGVSVVELDPSRPFSMARGRNVGFTRLLEEHPDVRLVQFLDGDTVLEPGWLRRGCAFLHDRPDVTVVCGSRREQFPDASIYNRLMDIELRGQGGEVRACGGDALYRVTAFRESGGFNEHMIAGEEPELCVRLRRCGGSIWRLDADMTQHDADMHSFWQWWLRSVRCGHAYAEGFALHGGAPEHHKRRSMMSALALGLVLPAAAAFSCIVAIWSDSRATFSLAVAVCALTLAAWGHSWFSAKRSRRALGLKGSHCALYAASCVLAKVPESHGILIYAGNRLLGRRPRLIEYHTAAREATS